MSIVLTGKLLQILPQQSGTGRNGQWVKQDFVIETPGEYPRKICISVWGDKTKELTGLLPGDEISASVNIESREFNERWYTDLKAWRIEKESKGPVDPDGSAGHPPLPPEEIPPPSDDDLLPF